MPHHQDIVTSSTGVETMVDTLEDERPLDDMAGIGDSDDDLGSLAEVIDVDAESDSPPPLIEQEVMEEDEFYIDD